MAAKAPSAETFTATFPMPRVGHNSLRYGEPRVFSGGFQTAGEARRYIMSKKSHVVVNGDSCVMTCSVEATARDFASAVEAAGGTVWDVRYLGKRQGYSVECILGLAWANYLADK